MDGVGISLHTYIKMLLNMVKMMLNIQSNAFSSSFVFVVAHISAKAPPHAEALPMRARSSPRFFNCWAFSTVIIQNVKWWTEQNEKYQIKFRYFAFVGTHTHTSREREREKFHVPMIFRGRTEARFYIFLIITRNEQRRRPTNERTNERREKI